MIDWLVSPLESEFVVRALGELLLLAVLAGTLGVWIVLRGMSYGAESLAHGMLPGLVLAALAGIPLAAGGLGGLVVAALAIALVGRVPRLDPDVAVSVIVTSLLGVGVLLALSPRTPAGLGALLFGDVLAVTDGDLLLTGAVCAATAAALALLHGGLLVVGFDPLGAGALGRGAGRYDAVLAVLLALATLAAVQALGSLLVVAMLVGPAATARLTCRRVGPMMITAGLIAAVSSVAGMYLSYYAETGAGASVACVIAAAYAVVLGARSAIDTARRRGGRGLLAPRGSEARA